MARLYVICPYIEAANAAGPSSRPSGNDPSRGKPESAGTAWRLPRLIGPGRLPRPRDGNALRRTTPPTALCIIQRGHGRALSSFEPSQSCTYFGSALNATASFSPEKRIERFAKVHLVLFALQGRQKIYGRDHRHHGAVSCSIHPSQRMACARLSPHISSLGGKELQTSGRSGCPKILQRSFSPSWTHRTPAGLPPGIPGMGLEIDGAIQHAPHRSRQFISHPFV